MQIRCVTDADIPKWLALSSEFDRYGLEFVSDLTEWYEGNDNSPAFSTYMKSKIDKQEAYMAVDANDTCLGIIAFSKRNNHISFFGVSHGADFELIGNALFHLALESLNARAPIFINEGKSREEWVENHRKLILSHGFTFHEDSLESGMPVYTFIKQPSAYDFML